MPLKFDEFVALVKAGYTKEEIDKMERAEDVQAAPAPESVEHKDPEPAAPATPAAEPEPAEEAGELAAVKDELAALKKAIQALNVRTSYRIENPGDVTPESILESILKPQTKEK